MSSTQSPIRPVKNDKAPLIRTVLVFGISYILPKSFGKAQTDQVPMEEMTLSTRLHCKSMPSGREERGNGGIKTIRNTRKNCITTMSIYRGCQMQSLVEPGFVQQYDYEVLRNACDPGLPFPAMDTRC